MARLKQLEPKKETIGGLNFYIRPFPAMVAANLTGDLASLLTPVLAALMPLVGNSDNESDGEDGDLMDIDVNDAAASISKSMEGFSGSKVESMMKKLLITHKNVVVELPVMDDILWNCNADDRFHRNNHHLLCYTRFLRLFLL